MLKLLLIKRMAELLYMYGPPQGHMTRWKPVFELVAINVLNFDPTTKNGKKALKDIDLSALDFSLMDDEKLLELYDTVHRRFWICM